MTEFPHEPVLPTLSDRLREAAVTRARARGDVVDEVVLDADGVIDLTLDEPSNPGANITQPPAVLAATRGQGAANADMSDLYAPPTDDGKSWWQRVRKPSGTASSPTLSRIPLSSESSSASTAHDDIVVVPDIDIVIVPSTTDDTPEIQRTDMATDEARPESECPECGGVGQRDLFDQVSKISYYSCNDCFTMWQASEN